MEERLAMADELDLVTNATVRNTGHDQDMTLRPELSEETDTALNALLAGVEVEGKENDDDDTAGTPDDKPADAGSKSTADSDPADTDTPSDPPDADAASGEGDASGGDAPGKPGSDGDVPPGDEFDKIELPPHTSTKAAESFNAVKAKAREEIEARAKEVAELKAKLEGYASKEVVTPEEKKELDDLRRFRASVEIEKDPAISKEIDERVSENDTKIYATLKSAGMTDEQLKKIKDFGGPLKLTNWDDIFPLLTASQQRVINSRLTDTENLMRDKELKIKAAKDNVDKYLQEKTVSSKVAQEQEIKTLEQSVNELLPHVEWAAAQEAPKDATPEARKAIDELNKATETRMQMLRELLVDRTPQNHATMAVAAVEALHLRAKVKTISQERDALKKRVEELTGKMDKIKKSSAPRSSSAPSKGLPATDIFAETAEEALDRHLKSI